MNIVITGHAFSSNFAVLPGNKVTKQEDKKGHTINGLFLGK